MKISVLGCGRWGSFIAWYLSRLGNEVTSWGPEGDPSYEILKNTGRNEYVALDEKIALRCDLERAVRTAVDIVISISSQGVRGFMKRITAYDVSDKNFVLCMKGIEMGTGRRLSQIAKDGLDASNRVAVWIGPGHVQEFYKGVPNCMVIDSLDEDVKSFLVEKFSSELIRFYYGADLIGNEVGAAAKNVIGIAAGMLDGLGLSTLKGALMARGTREIARLIDALGGNELSAYGLCHLGDYEATLFSPYSHNRMFGEKFVKHERFDALAEGYYAVDALLRLGKTVGADLPICRAVYNVLYKNDCPREAINRLFTRSIKDEF